MIKLVRAMTSLLGCIADVPGAAQFNLSVVPEPPEGAKRLGRQAIVPGCLLLEIRTETRFSHEVHFTGYWAKAE